MARIPADVSDTMMAVYSLRASQGSASKQVVVPDTVTNSLFSRLEVQLPCIILAVDN